MGIWAQITTPKAAPSSAGLAMTGNSGKTYTGLAVNAVGKCMIVDATTTRVKDSTGVYADYRAYKRHRVSGADRTGDDGVLPRGRRVLAEQDGVVELRGEGLHELAGLAVLGGGRRLREDARGDADVRRHGQREPGARGHARQALVPGSQASRRSEVTTTQPVAGILFNV
mgnify:CR=1 FL=1